MGRLHDLCTRLLEHAQTAENCLIGEGLCDYGDDEGLFAEAQAVLAEEKDGWQPIETAPKDGTQVLLFNPDGDGEDETRTMDIGRWDRWYGDEWMWVMNAGDAWGGCTHWRPLPEPPCLPTP